MADQKISQLPVAAALTGAELVPVVQSSNTVRTAMSDVKTYATSDLVSTYGFGNLSRDVPDLTAVVGNYSQIGRLLAGATGGTGAISGFVALPIDGTPSTGYIATANGRLWTGFKSGGTGTPTWTEYAKLASPTFTTQLTVGGSVTGGSSFSTIRSNGTVQSDVANATIFDSVPSTAASTTVTSITGFRAQNATLGASGTLASQIGFRILSNFTSATNNYGFYSDLASAANVWNIYFTSTAQSYFRGNIGVGSGKTAPTCAVDVNGQVAQSTATNIVAAGSTLATATALTAAYNVVNNVLPSTGVSLPDVNGATVWIYNGQATNALTVYPPTGTVNGAGSHSLAAGSKMMYIRISSGVWYTMS